MKTANAKSISPREDINASDSSYKWSKRILVVDDELSIAQAYCEILSPPRENVVPLRSSRSKGDLSAGSANGKTHFLDSFDVDQAHSYEQALYLFKQALHQGRPYAMGFFDVKLGPGPDGIELVKELQGLDPQLYAVFVTAYNDRSVDSIGQFLGADRVQRWDYMNKPFNSGEIVQKARNFVSLWNLERERTRHEVEMSEVRRKLMDSEKLSAVAAVARGVTHEFGNILMQIMGKAELNRNKDEEKMRQALERILEASQRAAQILERFKDLSGSAAEVHQPKIWLDPAQVALEALDLMEHSLRTHNVKVTWIKTDRVQVKSHPTSLLQVFINLFINAIHAMEGGSGQLDLSIAECREAVDPGAEVVEVRVRDYGPGVDPSLMDTILEPFFTTKGAKGSGLGLAICREIIEIEHGGQFLLHNHPVKGLEVILRIPKEVKS